MSKQLQDIQGQHHYVIGIDPDVDKNGVAIVEKETRHLECASLTFAQTLDYLQWVVSRASEVGAAVKVCVEAGWMNRTNWHLKRWDNRGQVVAKGVSQGRNEQVSRLLGEMCEHYGMDWQFVKPLRKYWQGPNRKITHDELCRVTGMKGGRTNQEERDAALIAWVFAGLPVRLSRKRT